MADISMYLFGKPEMELSEKINEEELRKKGDELQQRLHEIAEAMKKLSANGWTHELVGYNIDFSKKIAKKAAEKELEQLGIKEEVYEFD
jgi:adenylosuccinate lyase